MPGLVRLLPLALAVVVLGAVAFLPWADAGSGDLEDALRGRPGYETGTRDLAVAPVVGLKMPLGPAVAAAAGAAWIAALLGHVAARRGRPVGARQGAALAFVAFLVAAILTLVTLLRGPGGPIPTRFGIALVPRFGVGVWTALVGAVAGAVACALVVARTTPAPAPRG